MSLDIRLSVDHPDHHKTEHLIALAGERAYRCLIRLWCWIRINRPQGNLKGLDLRAIERVALWPGKGGAFGSALLAAGWLDPIEDGYRPHDWDEWQGFAIHEPERRDRARKAAEARWKGRYIDDANSNAAGNASGNASGNAASTANSNASSNAPSPSPSPSPSPAPLARARTRAREGPRAKNSRGFTRIREFVDEQKAKLQAEKQQDKEPES